jgi:hypothetical protein
MHTLKQFVVWVAVAIEAVNHKLRLFGNLGHRSQKIILELSIPGLIPKKFLFL